MSEYILHNYFRSTTSLRVRVALNMKGLAYEYVSYALLDKAHKSDAYLKLNPQGLVPAFEIKGQKLGNGTILTQSMAILEYLDEQHPEPPLLPKDALGRARVRALAQIIALDVHPINNLRVLHYIESEFGADGAAKKAWFLEWANAGMTALETRLQETETGLFCHGDTPSIADICLYAQMFNNERFGLDITPYPTIMGILNQCGKLVAFTDAAPMVQPDAPKT
ncbi:MAG: maleylacetoacetate isomerase [Robiginitomaculum sp.]|nr:maleylacetoacetate isomerase [Robiginitomaculum sp.]